MAIQVDRSKAKIVLKDAAKAKTAAHFPRNSISKLVCTHLTNGFMPGNTMIDIANGSSDAFTATATVPISVPAADVGQLANWNFGFIQFQKIGSLTLYYSGSTSSGGEVIIQGNIPPAMANNHGRDHVKDPNPPWLRVNTKGDQVYDAKTGLVTVVMGDHPMCGVTNELTNKKTNRTNYLRRMVDQRTFHTIFSSLDPQGNYDHLAYFKWVANWDYEFQWKGGSMIGASKAVGTLSVGFTADAPKSGKPTDSEVVKLLANPKTSVKLGTNEQSAALQNSLFGPPNRLDELQHSAGVASNFWT